MIWRFRRDVRARKSDTVLDVRHGVVTMQSGRTYSGLRKTHVVPGQKVKKGDPIGKR